MAELGMLRKLKFSIALPSLQLVLALSLWSWPVKLPKGFDTLYFSTPWLIARGINGPALPVGSLGTLFYRTDHTPPSLFGFGPEELCFFVGIVVLWFVVGRELDLRQDSALLQRRSSLWRTALCLLSGFIGIVLLIGGFELVYYHHWYNNHVGDVAEGILFLLWSLALIGFPVLSVSKEIRWKHRHSAQPQGNESHP